MANEKRSVDVRRIIKGIEALLNAEIPGTPRISQVARNEEGNLQGRVMYVALPGSGSKSKNVLSRRAQQVLATINRQRKSSSAALQNALTVNRNVIAGAIHELKQARFVRSVRVPNVSAYEGAGEFRPGTVNVRKNTRKKSRR